MADHSYIVVESIDVWDKYVSEDAEATVVVDFWATWCGPCKAIAPVFDDLAKNNPNMVFLKVDVDANPEVAQRESISAMPTFRVYKRGRKADELIGASREKLEQLVANNA